VKLRLVTDEKCHSDEMRQEESKDPDEAIAPKAVSPDPQSHLRADDRVGSLPIAFGNQTISQKHSETHGFAPSLRSEFAFIVCNRDL
jgi:hypothetical protein